MHSNGKGSSGSNKPNSKMPPVWSNGNKDEVVPQKYSKQVLRIFTTAKKKFVKINNGDHSLSNKKGLKKIVLELNKIVSDII